MHRRWSRRLHRRHNICSVGMRRRGQRRGLRLRLLGRIRCRAAVGRMLLLLHMLARVGRRGERGRQRVPRLLLWLHRLLLHRRCLLHGRVILVIKQRECRLLLWLLLMLHHGWIVVNGLVRTAHRLLLLRLVRRMRCMWLLLLRVPRHASARSID